MTDQKQYNELAARLQRLETLIQNNDAYQPPRAVKLDDMDMGPGLDFSIPSLDQYYRGNLQWDQAWDPNQFQDWQTQQEQLNEGFSQSQATVDEMLSRLGAIETFLSGGSNDTAQSNALDWGADTGDDGQTGTGDPTSGIGTMGFQDADAVAITGGSVAGITDLAVADGGTGASDAATARTNLGLGTIATQNASAVAITGGTASGLTSLALTSTGTFTVSTTATISHISVGAGLLLDGGSGGQAIIDGTSGVGILRNSSYPLGFFGSSGTSKANITGSRAGNAALQSLLSALASYGLITDSTT